MKSIKTLLATVAVVACAASAMAIQTQTIWVSDGGGGISVVPVTSTSGVVSYAGSDAFWSVVVSTGTSYPPAIGPGSITAPVMDLSVTATSVGGASSSLHPLSITFGADGFGPTAGVFLGLLSGHVVSGTANSLTFNTYHDTSPIATPPGTLLTTSGALAGPTYSSSVLSGPMNLASPYALEEVFVIQGGLNSASYSLDGSLITQVPDGGTTAMLLGAALSVLGLIRRKLA
jgi:hypothetical protein